MGNAHCIEVMKARNSTESTRRCGWIVYQTGDVRKCLKVTTNCLCGKCDDSGKEEKTLVPRKEGGPGCLANPPLVDLGNDMYFPSYRCFPSCGH